MKPYTIGLKRLKKLADEEDDALTTHLRPQKRGDCEGGIRPCPYIGCKYNLYLDVTEAGSIKLNRPDMEPEDVPPEESCCLDIADRVGGVHDSVANRTLDEIGSLMLLSRERVRQIVLEAQTKLKAGVDR